MGTAVQSADGEMEPSAGWIDPGLRFRSRRVGPSHLDAGEPVPLDWLSGCSLCLRPSAHRPPARFDPAFLLYYEDMDLCLRLGRNGAPVIWLPSPVIHHQRGEGSSTSSRRRLQLSTVSYLRFLRRPLRRSGWWGSAFCGCCSNPCCCFRSGQARAWRCWRCCPRG